MNNQRRIKCPSYKLNKSERIDILMEQIKEWIYSDELKILLKMFGGNDIVTEYGKDIKSDIQVIRNFAAAVWDYRGGKERWTVQNDEFVDAHYEEIMSCATALGLKGIVEPISEPDYILPLGGARASNRVRPAMARKLIDDYKWTGKTIVALSGTREISDAERPYMEYAIESVTEYDAINCGLELAFDTSNYNEERTDNENINSCSAIRTYSEKYENCEIYSLAAPSSDPEKRRANSADTFNYFLDRWRIKKGERLLLVTSCIYVPFQSLKFMDLAIDNGFEVDCVGSDVIDNFSLSKTSNFLQEIKGTIDAMYGLVNKYL